MIIHSTIKKSVEAQDIECELEDICFNLTLNSGVMYTYCFYINETDDLLTIVETTSIGTEELKIIPKNNIESIEIVYQLTIPENEFNYDAYA